MVASYVLGELPTQQERAALVRKLWGEYAKKGRDVCVGGVAV